MSEKRLDFAGLLATLEASGICFVLIGGLAMVAHGSAYVTPDVDLTTVTGETDMADFVTALAPFHPDFREAPSGLGMTIQTDLGTIDLRRRVDGVDSLDGLWQRSVVLRIRDRPIHVASLDDIIAMKRAAGRLQDQNHLLELLALQKLVQSGQGRGLGMTQEVS